MYLTLLQRLAKAATKLAFAYILQEAFLSEDRNAFFVI